MNIGSGADARFVCITTLPLRNRQHKENGTLVLISDVSEEVALQLRMKDSERLSTIGTLAAALAHEIRNPLESLSLNLELLKRIMQTIDVPLPHSEKIEKYISVFDSEMSRLAGVVENFLSFARPGKSEADGVRMDLLLRQIMELVENHAQSRKVTLCPEINDDPMIVRGFEDRLKQLFLNLVINGIDAMPEGGRLSIRTEIIQRTVSDGHSRFAAVHVRDTGEGISADRLHRLFEPFYSTRAQGTGLGLTIASRITEEHGGTIRVESVPGQGSEFTVELPVSF